MDCCSVFQGASPSRLGYGGMRFPVVPGTGNIDEEKAKCLIDRAIRGGITYFDTAWPYHEGQSELFLGRALSAYPRGSYFLATKLPCWLVESREQAREILDQQLERLQTPYVDFYLLHNLNRNMWEKMVKLDILSLLEEYQAAGKLHRLGFSFHDSYPVFEEILRYRSWDFCQIQLNYMDTEHQAGLRGLELARSLSIPVVVMEPVKGGSLAQLPEEVAKPLQEADPEATPSRWAMRWVASQPGVAVILSGMTTMEQLEDNLDTFSPVHPLSGEEEKLVEETARRLRARLNNGCTGCRYCLPCPSGVDIPGSFQVWNNMAVYQNQRLTKRAWKNLDPEERPDRCVGCGRCETLCPQQIPIREHLAQITRQVEHFLEQN
ncbi:aldo/keto reductase [Pseudoflavonifractor sp. AF19-9AC]|uniref:aldo/keto reductase n=1 Tax=Pseudoflavonifractor sp. AF19-9AC TaxID=2292244 RepID=UPI00242ED4BE|nr:aldo/keto reductase [Pseudoflavonifractor sp. AF19-9AC]